MATVGRSIGYSLVLTLALTALAFLVDRSADPIIDEFEKVIVPCQHGGEWVSAKETCRCIGPWTGKYCGECACENGGVCDTNNIQVATPGTLWGCRCPDRLVGPLCEQCNANLTDDGRCAGPCNDGFSGPDCNRLCSETPTFEDVLLDADGDYNRELEMLNYGGELHLCSGHGECDASTGFCDCAPFYYPSEDGRSSCARTCPFVDDKLCAGHGRCDENAGVVSCTCEFGYHLAPACEVACPGMEIDYIQEPCAGRGTCFLSSLGAAACDCGELFVGEACQYRCPTGAVIESSEACSGHGVCREDVSEGFTKAVCDCESPFQGPGCGCTRSLTCTGHGNCRADGTCECDVDPLFGKPVFRGERCEKCIPGHYGSDCRLQCTSHEPTDSEFVFEEGRSIHCHGRGTCAVANFGLADESVVCGACSGNFATESHCEECKDNFYPKFSVMDGDDVASCTTFATRTTCNGAGEPKDTFGRKIKPPEKAEAPCECDAPHADAFEYCSKCEISYYPSNLKEDPQGACSRRCWDKELKEQGVPKSVAHIETLECKNDGVCADDGLSCICADGYSGTDCGIACGTPDENGQQCSGHGQCVANTLQQFLEFEINVRGFTASRCECSPQDDLTEAERLKIFTGELLDQTGEATTSRNKRDWYGDTCGFGCLAAPWKDGTECNNERCEVIPIADDAGNPILQCTQDSQCGTYQDGMLKFYEGGAEKTVLTGDESRLRGAVSLSRRWSKRTGPFCHVTNTPFSVWEPNMKCAQRVNKDGEDPTKEAECHKYTTRYDCLHKGEGACHYIDVCMEALDEFDTWSYCYELMRTQEPPALRTKVCAESCNATLLKPVEWGKKCAHYRDRVPDSLCTANEMQNLDELCDLAEAAGVTSTQLVSDCNPALPPAGVAFTTTMDAADASAFCWEVSDQAGAMRYPFNFTVLLDTPEARHLQAAFHSLFTELGSRDTCVADSEVNPDSCANVPEPDDARANVLYLCSYDGVQVLESTDKSGLGVSCEPLPTVEDVSPFEMVCHEGGGAAEGLSEISLEEAVSLSARRGCALRAKSALHASSVAVDRGTAMSVCKRVLDAESPSACEQACGPEDQCSDLGTTHDGKRLLQCRRPDASDVGIDPDTGKCGNCLIGDCSITGREGGAEYRCVVPAAEIAESATPPRFEPCDDTLLLHLDELGGGTPAVGSVQGIRAVTLYETNETVTIYDDADSLDALSGDSLDGTPVLDGAALAAPLDGIGAEDGAAEAASETIARPPPARVEFDVRLDSDGRGRVAVLGKNGTLVSLLLHYYGGFGYDVNVPLEEELACDAGEEDNCKFVVAPDTTYRVVMALDWETELVSVKFADQSEVVRNITMEADYFVGVAASGTARVSQLWVFSSASATCASLHRKLGRSLTMQASHKPVEEQPSLSMSFCAGVEKAVAEHVKDCPHEREAVFGVPWHDYCAYVDHLKTRTSTGDCGDWQGSQALTVACEPVLSKFATPDCAKNAVSFDWETEYCAPLREDTKPDELVAAGCSAECIAKVAEDDFAQLCDDRDKYWDATDETVKPDFLPSDCNDNGKWKELDWVEYCTEKAENSAVGYCSAATCDCRGQGGWMTGDACELECPMADDYSPCAEDSLGGYCTYRRRDAAAADAFYEDPDNNLIKNHPAMQIQGRCACSHPDALAEEGCKVECDSPDGGPACNARTYMSNGTEWQLSACDAGGSGVCRCMSPLARRVNKTVSNWKGQSMNVLTVEFGDYEGTDTTAFPGMSAFRLYAHQGAKELMTRYFGAAEATWETMKLKFESSPADFDCSGRECDFHDVVIAQSLYSSSSFFGGSCSRRCPGVDTGEDMVELDSGCDIAESTLSGQDRVSEEGCQSECLDDFRCSFSKWEADTSNCYMYSTCVLRPDVIVPEGTMWRRRVQQRPPNLTPCSGRGQCGLTGQCQCDPAKELSLTDPITGEKNLIPSNQRHGLTSTPITTLDLTGYRGDKCDKVCPGYDETRKSMAGVCSGHGVCTRAGACQCDVNYVGVNCELRCPVKDLAVEDDQTVCSGHGTCSEARVFAGYDATEEDSKRYYMVTEAYRRWHNECPDNTPIDYFVLPFEGFPGSVASDQIKGGPGCESVPQVQDDPTLPFVRRPEIKLDGLSDYVFLDDEKALEADGVVGVLGVSSIPHSGRQGVFRLRFWHEGGELKQQMLFVEKYTRVAAQAVETSEDGGKIEYDRFYGYACGAPLHNNVQPLSSVETVADCAVLCESTSGCMCFQYREFYHRRFQGECVLSGEGALVDYPVVKVAYVHTTDGFLQKLDETSSSWDKAPLVPFDEFSNNYVQLHQNDASPTSCRAPTSVLGTNVASVEVCASLCAAESASGAYCTFFSYDPYSRRCSQVRTVSAECIEGMTPNSAGFYAISTANTGSVAPTAYTRAGSARIFPLSAPTRGRLTGTYVGRARPDFETAIASCDCLSNAAWGYWDGHRCQTCQKFYGSKTCSRKCPGVTAAGEPCFGFGKCLWGSRLGEGEEFFQSRCLCGDPAAPYVDDLASVGVWEVEEFDLHVEATFNGLPPSEAYEDPRNYNFASSTCSGCREGFGGLNCASTCSYCLFSGACSFVPTTVSVSVPCNCIGAGYDPYNSCCPIGFMMLEKLVHNDVGLLTTSLRRKRLSVQPGTNVATGKFYEDAVFPSVDTSLYPSRRWCTPGPGVYETEWMKPRGVALANACGDQGTLRDRGMRKLVIGAAPPKYFPQLCGDLGSDNTGEAYWKADEKTLWYTYPNKLFVVDAQGDDTPYVAAGGGISMGDAVYDSVETFAQACRSACGYDDMCNGAVVRTDESNPGSFACFKKEHVFIRSVSAIAKAAMGSHVYAFTAYRKQRQPDLCQHVDNSNNVCVLGSISYGEIPLCVTKEIPDGDTGTAVTTLNLQNRCEVRTDGVWQPATGAACASAAPGSVRVDENTDVLNRLVPNANALLFGAYGNGPYQASAAEVRANIGEMRPENPCSTLPGDYFWNKNNRSQCVSASTNQACALKDWRHCKNHEIGENATDFLHSRTVQDGTFPHNLRVNDSDLEFTVEAHVFNYSISPIDVSAQQQAFDAHVAAAALLEKNKTDEIDAITERIAFVRPAETDTYGKPHVYNFLGNVELRVDDDRNGYKYDFVTNLLRWEDYHKEYYRYRMPQPPHPIIDSFDPVTWPRGQQQEHCSLTSTASYCLPMGLEQLVNVSREIADFYNNYRYWNEKQLLLLDNYFLRKNDIDNRYLRWWDSSYSNDLLYASKLEYLCMRDHCDANAFDEQWIGESEEDLETGAEARIDTCYTSVYGSRLYYETGYVYSDDLYTCPAGCTLRNPDDQDDCVWCGSSLNTDDRCFISNTDSQWYSGVDSTKNIWRPNDACKATCDDDKLRDIYVDLVQSGNSKGLYGGGYAKNAYDNLIFVENKLQEAKGLKQKLEDELNVMRKAHLETNGTLLLAIENARAGGKTASCTTDVPCDICRGHCENNEECMSDLKCGSSEETDRLCGGEQETGNRYCIRSDQSDVSSKLYLAGSVTAAGTATTWLMLVGGGATPTLPVKIYEASADSNSNTFRNILKRENGGFPECVFGCTTDDDCAPGLLCGDYTRNEPLGACKTWEDTLFYKIDNNLVVLTEEEQKEQEDKKLCYNPIADSARKVVGVFARSDHNFDDTTTFDSLSAARASSRYTPSSYEPTIISGTFFAEGSAGTLHPHGHAPWVDAVPPRSVATATAEECVHICDATHGCTAAHWGDKKCNLFHFNPALGCSVFKSADNADHTGFVRYADACRLCKSRGMRPHIDLAWTDNSTLEGAFCDQSDFHDPRPESCIDLPTKSNGFLTYTSKLSVCKPKHCALFPTLSDDDKIYAWDFDSYDSPWHRPRCPPTRSGVESDMLTRTVMVGKTFTAVASAVFRAHPEITTFYDCENACAETPTCRAWSFDETYEKDEAIHVCKVYNTAPTPQPTASESGDTFLAAARVGFVERDFSPKIAFFDDGEHPACDCFDGSTAYNCACLAESFEPFQSKPSDTVYGCAGHGVCSSLEYKCVCDDGYAWMWGENVVTFSSSFVYNLQNYILVGDVASNKPGFTCRECPEGTFKDKTVSACTSCPVGKYQDARGGSTCKSCPFGYKSTREGALRHTECQTDAVQQCIEGMFVDAMGACSDCPVGFFSITPYAFTCQECAVGFYSDSPRSAACKTCSNGRYAENTASSACTACIAGKTGNGQNGCEDCAPGKFTANSATTACADCPAGWYAQNTMSVACTQCEAGKVNPDSGVTACKDCAMGYYNLGTAANIAMTQAALEELMDQLGTTNVDLPPDPYDHMCLTCPIGFARSEPGDGLCTQCPAGKSSHPHGATNCVFCHDAVLCRTKYFGPSDATYEIIGPGNCAGDGKQIVQGNEEFTMSGGVCKKCEKGEYYTLSGEGESFNKITTCVACPAGYQSVGIYATSSCSACAPGRYQNQAKQDRCLECADGKYGAAYGQAECTECAAGRFTAYSTSKIACAECFPNTFQDEHGNTGCKHCPVGYFSTETGATSANVCLDTSGLCEPGKFLSNECEAADDGDNCCQFCPPGKTTPAVGTYAESECQLCPSGWSSRGEKSTHWWVLSVFGNNPLNTCRKCPAGKSASIEYNKNGGFENDTNSDYGDMCHKCQGNQYSLEPGQAVCDTCPFGWHSNEKNLNDFGCSECPAGKYTYYPMQIGGSDCLECIKCHSRDIDCLVDQYYYFKEPDSEENGCRDCPEGYSQKHPFGNDCLYGTCPAGQYVRYGCTEEDGDCCEFCPAGSSTPDVGTYREDQCQFCPAGWSSPGDVTVFGKGGYTSNACHACPAGFAASLLYNRNRGHENDITTTGTVACRACSAHEYSDEEGQEQCKTCPVGYRALSPDVNTMGCEACAEGKFSLYPNPGFTCEDALCDAGSYYDELSDLENPTCQHCPAGFYQDHRRGADCLACPSGYEAQATGSSQCTLA